MPTGALLLIAACGQEPIEWEAPRDMPGTIGARTRLTMNADQAGHTFDERLRVVRSNEAVFAPRIALRHGRVALAWLGQGSAVDTALPQYTRVRMGRLR